MDPTITADLEAPKDPGALKAHSSVTDVEILGKVKYFCYNKMFVRYVLLAGLRANSWFTFRLRYK